MKDRENAWALEQAARYVEKLIDAKTENQNLREQLELMQETLNQAKKEIQYLNKLNHTQQQYITKLENAATINPVRKKETKIRTLTDLRGINEDAC